MFSLIFSFFSIFKDFQYKKRVGLKDIVLNMCLYSVAYFLFWQVQSQCLPLDKLYT